MNPGGGLGLQAETSPLRHHRHGRVLGEVDLGRFDDLLVVFHQPARQKRAAALAANGELQKTVQQATTAQEQTARGAAFLQAQVQAQLSTPAPEVQSQGLRRRAVIDELALEVPDRLRLHPSGVRATRLEQLRRTSMQ